ncbi:MAG: AI-2E family transporter [Actinomycetota bacterium]
MDANVAPGPDRPGPSRPPTEPSWVTRAVITFLVGALALLVLVRLVEQLRHLLMLLLVAFFFSFAMEPAVTWLDRRGWRRGVATGVVILVLAVISVVMMFSVGRLMFDQAAELVERAPELIEDTANRINEWFGTDLNASVLSDAVAEADLPIRDIATNLAGSALSVTTAIVGVIFNFFTILLFAFYLTADGPKVRRTVCSFFPPHRQRVVLYVWEVAIEKTGGYLYSRALLAALAALCAWLFFVIVDLEYALALALWLGVTSQFIPTVGTYIGGALPVLIALVTSPPLALAVLAYLAVYQQIENYFLSPRVTAHTMSLHPAVAFGSVLAGAALAGGIGALLALPAAAILQAVGTTFVQRHEVIDEGKSDVAETKDIDPEQKANILHRLRRAKT